MKNGAWIFGVLFLLLGYSGCQKSIPKRFVKSINSKIGGNPVSDKKKAYALTKTHRNREFIGRGEFKNGRSFYFTRGFLVDTMLAQKGAVGLNFYLALGKNDSIGKVALLYVVSVNEAGGDLTGSYYKSINDSTNKKQTDYIIGETKMRCPNNCDEGSALLLDQQ